MSQADAAIIPISIPRLLGRMVLSNLMIAVGLWAGFGLTIMIWGCIIWGILSIILFVVSVIRQRPRVVLTSEGFTFYPLLGIRSHQWNEIGDPFAVIRIGLSKVVAYRLTEECKARLGKKPTSRFSGYDAVLVGALQLSPQALAGLLNEYRERNRTAQADRETKG